MKLPSTAMGGKVGVCGRILVLGKQSLLNIHEEILRIQLGGHLNLKIWGEVWAGDISLGGI